MKTIDPDRLRFVGEIVLAASLSIAIVFVCARLTKPHPLAPIFDQAALSDYPVDMQYVQVPADHAWQRI